MKNQQLIGDLKVQPNGEFSFQYVATRKGVGKRIWCKVTIYRTGNLWNVWAKGYEDALPCLHCKVKKSETLQSIFDAIDERI